LEEMQEEKYMGECPAVSNAKGLGAWEGPYRTST
jgi:hypothetical protein